MFPVGSSYSVKKKVSHKEAHTAPTMVGVGDYYGTGVKNKLGRMRSNTVGYSPLTPKQQGMPPRSLA